MYVQKYTDVLLEELLFVKHYLMHNIVQVCE